MDIISKKDAVAKGLATFYTGKVCKRGHDSYRYVKNGACSTCVKLANGRPVDANVDARREAKGALVQAKFRLFAIDLEVFAAAAYAMTLARFPVLMLGDVHPGLLPTDNAGGAALYKFNCHEGDLPQLRALAVSLTNAHSADGQALRERVHGKTIASTPVAPVPEWSRQPQPGDPALVWDRRHKAGAGPTAKR